MTSKIWKTIISVLAIGAIALGALVIKIPTGPMPDQLQREIEKTLPVGSSRDLVAEFAKNHGMEYSSYLQTERMINAIKRGVSKGLFFESSVYVRFYFDERNLLQRFTVEEVGTGL